MGAFVGSVVAGVLSGLLAYAVSRLLFPDPVSTDFSYLIVGAAVVGAVVTAWVARRFAQGADKGRDANG